VKKLILFTVVVSLLALATSRNEIVSGAGEQGGPSEGLADEQTYVSEVVLRAPWAEKNLVYDGEESPPGEFGLHSIVFPDSLRGKLPDPPLPQGPTAFTVAPNEDIYITDPLNYRIQSFGADGQFKSFVPGIRIEWYKWGLVCVDRNQDLYLLCWGYNDRQVVQKYNRSGELVLTYPLFEQRGRGRGAGTRLECDSSGRLFLEYYKRMKRNDYILMTFQIGTVDQAFSAQQQKSTETRGSRTNRSAGKIGLDAWNPPDEAWGPEVWNPDYVDKRGHFYLYWPTAEGITITKWHKQ
jgi:hypothetical protein